LTDGTDVLYNKFNVDSSSPPDSPPQRPNSDYSCVVATTGQWRVARCDEQHRVVCQSDTLIGRTTFNLFIVSISSQQQLVYSLQQVICLVFTYLLGIHSLILASDFLKLVHFSHVMRICHNSVHHTNIFCYFL